MNFLWKRWFVTGSLVLSLLLVITFVVNASPIATTAFSTNSKVTEGGNGMQNFQVPSNVKPANHRIVKARQSNFFNFDEVKKVATFKVKFPKKIPEGFELTQLQHVRPDLPDIPATTHNDTVSATYSNGKSQFTIIQGYFSGGDVPKGPLGASEGKVDVAGVEGKWVKGSWAVVKEPTLEDPSSKKEWLNEPLRLGWYQDNIGYTILANDLELKYLIEIANSLE